MSMKSLAAKLAAFLALLVSASFLAAAAYAQPQQEIKIGIVTDRSGALSYYGDMSINGFILGLMYALDIKSFETVVPNLEWKLDWEGRTIHIIAASNVPAGQQVPDPVTATKAAEDLILNKGVEILVGCADSASAIALTQIAEKYRVVFLVVPAADHEITKTYLNRYVFQISSTTWHDAIAGGSYAAKLGKTVAFLAPSNPWGRSTVSAWSTVIQEKGGVIVADIYAPATTTDFTPYIQALLASKAEVFVPVWAGATALALYQQINASGVYQRMKVTSGIPDLATLNLLRMGLYLPQYEGMMKYAWNLP
ncbi:MAG: ABC transporter substrate-binding protein, partial [Thermofilum sp.]